LIAGWSLGAGTLPAATVDGVEHFEKEVRPLLIAKCYSCHSPEKKVKGGLRLDTKEGWQTGGDSGPAILPHKPEASLVSKAISYTDRDLKMPPKQKLSDREIAVLNTWIANGAPDPRTDGNAPVAGAPKEKTHVVDAKSWWSFQPVRKPSVPEVKDTAWPRNAIDRFVLAKLEAQGLAPSADASSDVLARRLSYDLTGLPATSSISDIEALLASPAFAERWASHWLDVARFAESSGGGRTLPFKDAWRYRDYVIESLRDDVPMDRFITEQIAGDLLPHASPAERRKNVTATGLLVLGPTNYEEQDKAALRMDIVDEQLDLIGKVFMGMTIGCARCHDHKFDPIPTRDYYALAGILRSTKVIKDPKENVAHWIDTPLPMDEPVETALQAKEAKVAALKSDLEKAKLAVKKTGLDASLASLKPGGLPISELPGIVVDDSDAKLIGTWKPSTVFKTYIGAGYITDHNRDKGGLTATFQPKMIEAGRYEVRLAYIASHDRDTKVPLVVFHADGEETIKVDQTEAPPIDGRWISLGTFRFEANGEGHVLISNTDTTNYVTADAVQFLKVDASAPTVATAGGAETKPALTKRARQKAAASNRASDEAKELAKTVSRLTAEIKRLEASEPKRPEAMTVAEQDAIEDSPIHIRGQIRNLGPVVPRGFLSTVPVSFTKQVPKDQSGRLELSQWLTHRSNPLTARVLANRIWGWLMGEGLVRTPDNFGSTGELPTHPELLDYLATELMESGWDLKHMVRLIVESRTYRQSSAMADVKVAAANPQLVDPDNRMLWRMNRRRLDAECIRDTMLTVSGALDQKIGGPNVDAGAVNSNDAGAQNLEYGYIFTDLRRSVYTPAFRNKRLELFEVFDFADINGPVGKRNTSTVAPQALYLLNHEFAIAQSRKAADKLLGSVANGADETDGLIKRAYREALGREPTEREARLARDFVAVSDGEPDKDAKKRENWALLIQALFASVDFRYLN
jgi:hypothetical protein